MTKTDSLPEYKIFAIRYATHEARRADHFVGGVRNDAPMPMDYFTWVVVGPDRTFLVDTGFTKAVAATRKRQFLRCPIESLQLIGVSPEAVTDVIITHLHYDHAGNSQKLPNARFHLQERELAFCKGRYMQYRYFAHGFEAEEIAGIVRLNLAQRVTLYDGDAELEPGLTLHLAAGHTPGLQVVHVHTRRGNVVLASDSSHYYEHIQSNRLFPGLVSATDSFDSYRKVEQLASSPRHIIPGHDPLVMRQYKAPSAELQGIVVSLDLDPIE